MSNCRQAMVNLFANQCQGIDVVGIVPLSAKIAVLWFVCNKKERGGVEKTQICFGIFFIFLELCCE